MAAPTIPTLPPAPAPTDPTNVFNSRAFTWVAALTGWTTAVNALVAWINANLIGYTVVPISATDYDLNEDHAGKYLRFTASSAKTVNVNASAVTTGSWDMRNAGTGDITIAAADGVTINAPSGGTLEIPQNGTVTLLRVAANVYDLIGQVNAA